MILSVLYLKQGKMTGLRELLAYNIKTLRKNLGLSQGKLAEKVDTAPTYIARIETGKRFPSVDMLERLAAALGIDPPALFAVNAFQYKTLEQRYHALLADIDSLAQRRLQELHC
jgi:transcriptional regulator with XRE-family HTH domain